MDFLEVGKTIARMGAPILGGLLGGPPGAAIGTMVASALGDDVDPSDPASIAKALKDDPQAAIKLRELETNHIEELRKLQIAAEQQRLVAETKQLETVNQTMRAEYGQADTYVSRWRPTLGYGVTFSWVMTWCAIAWVLVTDPAQAPAVVAALAASSVLWGVALSVLGISVHSRSQDKQIAAGHPPSVGIMGAIAQRIAGEKKSPPVELHDSDKL